MTRPTIMRRHRFRVAGGDIAIVAQSIVTGTPLHTDTGNTVIGEIARYLNPHTCDAAGYGQLLADDTEACMPRAAVVPRFAGAPVAGLDLFVLDNGNGIRQLNAIMWADIGTPPNTFPVHPHASFAGCANVSARTSGADASDAMPRDLALALALAKYLHGVTTGYPDTFGVPRVDDIVAATFVDTLAGPSLDDDVWWEELPEPGADIHADMQWQHGVHATYLLTRKYAL